MMKRLLVVHHTVSPATHALHLAVMAGARDPALDDVDVVEKPALTASAVDVLEADGFLLGSPVNLGYISGALKHFFDQIYDPCIGATRGRPFGVYLHSNSDAAGALRAISTITTGLEWRQAQAPLVVSGEPRGEDKAAARELGASVAAGLLLD
jgi:NAD(P)H-dependent FMN reductase